METSPTTDIMLRLGMSAARIAAFMAGKMASVRFAPNANRVSHSCFFSATSASNRSTATAGPDIEFPIIMPAVGTCNMLRGIVRQCLPNSNLIKFVAKKTSWPKAEESVLLPHHHVRLPPWSRAENYDCSECTNNATSQKDGD